MVFREYVVEGGSAPDVAKKFGMDKNAVYQIKARILDRLKSDIRRMAAELGEV